MPFTRTIIAGDFVDFYEISDYDRSPERKYTTEEELDYSNQLLDEMGSVDDYLEGNHEYRLRRSIANGRIKWGRYANSVSRELRLRERGIRFHKYGDDIRVGPVLVCHDYGPAGKTAMQATYNLVRYNVAFVHSHRAGIIYDGAYRGHNEEPVRHVVMNGGHLSDVHQADYATPATKAGWQLAVSTIQLSKSGIATCQVHAFVKNKQKKYECTILGRTYMA